MPVVNLSDGRTANFPDGMSQEDMAAALRQIPPSHPTAGPSGDETTDWGRKLATGGTVALGATLGLPRAAAQGLDWLAGEPRPASVSGVLSDPVGSALRGLQPEGGFSQALGSVQVPGGAPAFPTMPQAIEGAFQTTGATEYKPATWAGRRTMDALTAAPLAVANPGSLPALLMGGAGAGQAAETTQQLGGSPAMQTAAALLGGGAGARVGSGLANTGANAAGIATPFNRTVSSTRADLADLATKKYDIPVRGAMVEGRSSPVRLIDSELNNVPLSNMRGSNEAIQTAYNRAVGKTFGADASELSTDVFAKAQTDLVNRLNGITPRMRARLDNDLINDLGAVETSFERLKGQGQTAPVKSAVSEILDVATGNNGVIPGDVYHSLIKKGGHLDRMQRSADPDVRHAAGEIKEALENAVERSLPANSPVLTEFRDWRRQWRSMRMAEDAVDASGNVSGAKLGSVANRQTTNYRAGEGGDIAELGRIGSALFPEPPQSGTAARSMVWKALGAPAAVAGGISTALMHPELAGALAAGAGGVAGTAALGAGAAKAASAYLRSPKYLERAILTGQNPDAFRFQSPDLLTQMLMAPELAGRANTPSLPR